MSKSPTFCPFFTANFYESTENQILKLEVEFVSQNAIWHSEKVTSLNLRKKLLNLLQLLPKTHKHTQ